MPDSKCSGARLEQGLRQAAAAAGLPHSIARVGSMMTLFFNPDVVTDWEVASRSDTASYGKYFWGLIERGVYMPCSQYEALFISAAHQESDIDATIAAAEDVLAELSVSGLSTTGLHCLGLFGIAGTVVAGLQLP